MVMVGDRGMITTARITALNKLGDDDNNAAGQAKDTTGSKGKSRARARAGERELPGGEYGWITALRAPPIKKLMAEDGRLQLSFFDEQDLAEITSEDFPGERLIACRNPVLAADRARTREELLAATEKLLAPLTARVQAGRLSGAEQVRVQVRDVIGQYHNAHDI